MTNRGTGYGIPQSGTKGIASLGILDRQAAAYARGVAALEAVLAYDGQGLSEDELSRELKADPVQGTRWDPSGSLCPCQGMGRRRAGAHDDRRSRPVAGDIPSLRLFEPGAAALKAVKPTGKTVAMRL